MLEMEVAIAVVEGWSCSSSGGVDKGSVRVVVVILIIYKLSQN